VRPAFVEHLPIADRPGRQAVLLPICAEFDVGDEANARPIASHAIDATGTPFNHGLDPECTMETIERVVHGGRIGDVTTAADDDTHGNPPKIIARALASMSRSRQAGPRGGWMPF